MTAAQPELVRAIGRWSLVALVINCIIGSGIFGLPAVIAGQLGAWAPLGYVVAAAGIGIIMGCFAEVASRFTEAGGPYLYARAAFGSFVGIETGWLTWLARLAASAANANLFVDYLGGFLPAVTRGAPRMAVLSVIIGALSIINVRGVRSGTRTSNFFTVAKLVPLVVLVLAGAVFLASHGWQGRAETGGPIKALDALLLLVFAYGGFESAVIPLGAARAVMGSGGAALLTLGALFSTYGLLSANMLNVPRLTYALARQGEFPAFFGATHPRFRTPHVSIAVFALLLWALALYGSFRWNAVLSAVARLFTYAAVCVALPVLRHRQPGEARFRLPGGNVLAAVGVAYCGMVVVGSRAGWKELMLLAVTAAVAAGNWWLARSRPEPAS